MTPIEITDLAAKEISAIIADKKVPEGYGLRVVATGGACAGVNYTLGFDEKAEDDNAYEIKDIPVYIKKKDFMHIIGVKVDFLDTPEARGFVFKKD